MQAWEDEGGYVGGEEAGLAVGGGSRVRGIVASTAAAASTRAPVARSCDAGGGGGGSSRRSLDSGGLSTRQLRLACAMLDGATVVARCAAGEVAVCARETRDTGGGGGDSSRRNEGSGNLRMRLAELGGAVAAAAHTSGNGDGGGSRSRCWRSDDGNTHLRNARGRRQHRERDKRRLPLKF